MVLKHRKIKSLTIDRNDILIRLVAAERQLSRVSVRWDDSVSLKWKTLNGSAPVHYERFNRVLIVVL
jgi:hypothetical protein